MLVALATAEAVPVVNFDMTAIATLVGIFVPVVVSLITKSGASAGLRAALNIALNLVVAVVLFISNPGGLPITWPTVVNTIMGAFIASMAAYKGLWSPTGVANNLQGKGGVIGADAAPVEEAAPALEITEVADPPLPMVIDDGHDDGVETSDVIKLPEYAAVDENVSAEGAQVIEVEPSPPVGDDGAPEGEKK